MFLGVRILTEIIQKDRLMYYPCSSGKHLFFPTAVYGLVNNWLDGSVNLV